VGAVITLTPITDKIVHNKHKKLTNTKPEKEYVKTIIHNLSLQRWTDQENYDYLKREKKIEISRSRITTIRNNVEKQAEKWYVELKDSRYKYLALYKERIYSLLSYQRKLNNIIEFYTTNRIYHDTVIKAYPDYTVSNYP